MAYHAIAEPGRPIAVLMSRFPKVSETFILNEISELERQGLEIEIFPLLRERAPVQHADARERVCKAHFVRFLSREVAAAQIHWLRRRPRAYLGVWAEALRANRRSPKFLIRALAVVPLAAAFARRMEGLGVRHAHAHYATHPALAAWAVHRLTAIPYSFTAHAHDIYVERPMLTEKVRDASFVRTISRHNKELLDRLCAQADAPRIEVIRTGVDPARFRPRVARAAGRRLEIVCVASLEEYKGHRYLVEACAGLRTRGIDFHCSLVGEGDRRRSIERLVAERRLERVIELLGARPTEEVEELVARADILVLPSVVTSSGKKEGIPVALMEAMASGVPVVATAISGIPELVEDEVTGLLVPPASPARLAAAIARLHEETGLRQRVAAAGRGRVLAEYDLHANAAALAARLTREMGA
jgi:glycosyltransferase involved in cell wall biosynthesis